MKNTYQQFVFASFLVLVSQGIKAQFDDVYYDPSKVRKEDNYYKETIKPNEKEVRLEEDIKSKQAEESYRDSGDYDDEYSEYDDQDYYYASRIKRFHRPYRGFSYYDPCYVDYYFYDPFSYDPWYWERDIYSASWYYSPYYSYTRYHYRPWRYNYWNYWDGYYGWGCNPYSYSYWPGSYYSNNYYYGGNYYNNYHNNHNGHGYNDNPKGTYKGSRGFGLTNTSKRGPVRVYNPSPKVFTDVPGDQARPAPDKQVVRSADGDTYSPRPEYKPERNSVRKELPGNTNETPKPERGGGRDAYKPKETPGERTAPDRQTTPPKREYRPERSEPKPIENTTPPKRKEREEGERFKPHRDFQSEAPSNSRPESKPRERSEFSQPRMERSESRSSSNSNSNSNSGSNSNKESSSGGNRRTPR